MNEFKPGDVIQAKWRRATFVVAEVKDTGLLRVEDNNHGLMYAEPHLVELVEPSVPVSKIREVCEGLMIQTVCNDHDSGWNSALEMVMAHLTDEETP